jgi:hypothetical protein
MSKRRSNLLGVFGVLLALMAQLGAGASVPRIGPIVTPGAICHTEDDTGGAPSREPTYPAACPVCPLCGGLDVQGMALASDGQTLTPPAVLAIQRTELPPPSTAPPSPQRPPSQPRAPPIFS